MLTYYNTSYKLDFVKSIKDIREQKKLSQRSLATLAGLSYKTIQLLESGKHDPQISTLSRVAKSLGYPPHIIERHLQMIFESPPDSVPMISERIATDGDDSFKIWLFEFVDAFRSKKDPATIANPPSLAVSDRMKALIAGTVETLCDELHLQIPEWCKAIGPLGNPWFVSGVESLKAMALVESLIHFRKRNIFVLENFLSRR